MRSDRRVPDAQERIEHRLDSLGAEELDAVHRQLNRKRCRMRTLFVAALDRLVGDEPRVPAATTIASARVAPAGDVRLVCVGHTQRHADRSACGLPASDETHTRGNRSENAGEFTGLK